VSTSAPALIATEQSADGVLSATIDMPGRSMNVFSEALMDALEGVINQVAASSSILGVVMTSGKSSFLAGADLPMVRGMTELAKTASHEQMFAHCGRIGRMFLRIEQSNKPWVAAVNGTALGGGLELAMACHARVIDTQCKALIGLPEVKLGLLPGAGGTQRLPRLVGLDLGLDLLLSGRSLSPAEAVQTGLFEACPSNTTLADAARIRLKSLMREAPGRSTPKYPNLSLACPPDTETSVQALAERHGISNEALAHYPAYRAIIRSVLAGAGLDLAAASDAEMTRFLDLMFDPVADHMISTLFIERQRVEKAVQLIATSLPTQIRSGPLGPQNAEWQALLTQSGIALISDANLQADVIELDRADFVVPIRFNLCQVPAQRTTIPSDTISNPAVLAPCLILSRTSEHGRVIECLLTQTTATLTADQLAAMKGALASLAKKARCFLFFTDALSCAATQSLLLAMQHAKLLDEAMNSPEEQNESPTPGSLDRIALAAAQALEEGRVGDPGIIDVAAVLAGIAPAYCGGPLSYAWSHREKLNTALASSLGASFESFEHKLQAYQASKKSHQEIK
jgi:3-hydroxyacyl-CoA dehydrogenase / enoyl-CoA hydratase / 3-hydroxybutyryl-CoA epimerase